jgi:hypothetical protein
MFHLCVVLLLATKGVSCCYLCCCSFVLCFGWSTWCTRGRDVGCHARNNNNHRFLQLTLEKNLEGRLWILHKRHSLCLRFWGQRRKKVPRHVRTRKKRQLSFSFRVFPVTWRQCWAYDVEIGFCTHILFRLTLDSLKRKPVWGNSLPNM